MTSGEQGFKDFILQVDPNDYENKDYLKEILFVMDYHYMFVSDYDVLISFAKTLCLEILQRDSFGCHRDTMEFLRGLPEFVAGCVKFDCFY